LRLLASTATRDVEGANSFNNCSCLLAISGPTRNVIPVTLPPGRARLATSPSPTASALDVPIDAIEKGIRQLPGVPGRFEVASTRDDDVTVVVDYAHTDDALRNLLETARPLAGQRLITVFGAGGDRDRTKRPLMGMVAARLSDVVIITSDNTRGEDPMRIIEEVKRGADAETRQSSANVLAVLDRHDAIVQAIGLAAKGDVVLIAGKGHEKYQEVDGRTLPFDDVAVAREGLEARRVKSRAG